MILMKGAGVSAAPQQAAGVETVQWSELESRVAGKEISTTLPGGIEVKGRVRSVNEVELVLDVSKSSNSSLYPQGARSIPRRLISEVKVKDSARKWLAPVLSAAAGGGAFMAFLPYGISENRRGVSDGTRISQNVAVGAAAAFAGYFAGKKLATSTHILRIAP